VDRSRPLRDPFAGDRHGRATAGHGRRVREAIELVNHTEFGLDLYILTDYREQAEQEADSLELGWAYQQGCRWRA